MTSCVYVLYATMIYMDFLCVASTASTGVQYCQCSWRLEYGYHRLCFPSRLARDLFVWTWRHHCTCHFQLAMHPQNYLAPHRRFERKFERSFTSPDLSLPLSLDGYFPDEDSTSISDDFSQRNTLESFTVGYIQYSYILEMSY